MGLMWFIGYCLQALLLISLLPMSFTRNNGLKYTYIYIYIYKWSIDHWVPYKVTCFSMAAPFLFPEISLDLSTHGSSCSCIDCIFNETQVVTLLLSALSCLDQPSPTRFFWKSCCWGLWDPWDSCGVTLHFKRLGCHIMYTCKELV